MARNLRSLKAVLLSMVFSAPFYCVSSKIEASESNKYSAASKWQGQYLDKPNGGFFARIFLRNFKKSNRGNFFTSAIVVKLKNKSTKALYQISQPIQANNQPEAIWILPQGVYSLEGLSLIDNVGISRNWQRQILIEKKIRHLYLSNFGDWVIRPSGKRGLSLSISNARFDYVHRYKHHSFIGLIDGDSGNLKQLLGGKNVLLHSKNEFSSQNEARSSYKVSRSIFLKYQLDLGKNNQHSKKMLSVITGRDIDLRRCYTDILDEIDIKKTTVRFNFSIDKRNGAMDPIIADRSLKNIPKLTRCLYLTFGQMQFPFKHSFNGTVTLHFQST